MRCTREKIRGGRETLRSVLRFAIATDGAGCLFEAEDRFANGLLTPIGERNGKQRTEKRLKTDNRHFFIKSPIRKYKNGFRIVIVFSGAVPYDRTAMCFDVNEKERGISLSFGPETAEEEFKQLSAEFSGYGVYK